MNFKENKSLNNRNINKNKMTICIGVLCENGKKAIIISDKMITIEGLSQEFEHKTPKMYKINNSCIAVSAGDALMPVELFRSVNHEIKGKANPSIIEIVTLIKKCYMELRKNCIEEEHLKMRGFNLESFYESMTRISPQIAIPIDNKIMEYDLGIDMILAGIDEGGAYIYQITNPGVHRCFNGMGYVSTGSGTPHALHSFISNDYNPEISLKEGLFLAFEAKKLAENAPGVGNSTDIWIVDKDGIKEINQELLKDLEMLYQTKINKQKESHSYIKDGINNLSII